MTKFFLIPVLLILFVQSRLHAQEYHDYKDSLVLADQQVKITADARTGKVSYHFSNGIIAENTIAYIRDLRSGYLPATAFNKHYLTIEKIKDSVGSGVRLNFRHTDVKQNLSLTQHITLYKDKPYLLISTEANNKPGTAMPETRDICAMAILPDQKGRLFIPGSEPRILDVPFDNDNWVNLLERKWPAAVSSAVSGISYEFSAVYDNTNFSGLVIGSVSHNFWKTGIVYRTDSLPGLVDSLTVFGGAATADDKSKKPAYGGLDGTHDHTVHGTMTGNSVNSPVIYLCGSNDIRKAFIDYGRVNARLNGRLNWKGYAPVYWNSFGVEGVLGNTGVMMPPATIKISDFIQSMGNFNSYAKPVLSIDSYDQSIYTTDLLASLGRYAKKKNQQMGFYFIPFALWTWKNSIEDKQLPGSGEQLKNVVLRDQEGKPILYKDGDYCAYAMDPTHPAVKAYIINQLQKAKAINASFIKIDFLTAGSLESTVRYDPAIRSGMQAYNKGMKMLKHLTDSIMGPDVFITMAISPMFPSQYAHTRFVSTDVYSHLRDDQEGFPHYGSTESSLATGSHLWWVQNTLWPFTNMDVSIMKNFQHNPDLTEQEIKVRIYAMMAMGSILGDGSDFRNKIAADRARIFLDNKDIAAFFSHPKAFTPLKQADGESFDQQLSFYLPGETTLLAMFNFDRKNVFDQSFSRKDLGLDNQKYILKDFLTGSVLGQIEAGQATFSLSVSDKNAVIVKLVPGINGNVKN